MKYICSLQYYVSKYIIWFSLAAVLAVAIILLDSLEIFVFGVYTYLFFAI